MRRVEALILLGTSLALIVAGLVWLFGPYGLLGAGAALGLLTLFVFDVRPDTGRERRAEPVVDPARALARR